MLDNNLKMTVCVQVFHLALCIVWNLTGVYQLGLGLQPIGPTASVIGAGVMALLVSGLILAALRRWKWLYLSLSIVAAAGAFLAIYGGFTKDPSQWPSLFWQYAGILLNFVGMVGFLLALKSFKHLSSTNN